MSNNKLKRLHTIKPGGCTIFSKIEEGILASYVVAMFSDRFPVKCYDLHSIKKCYAGCKGMMFRQLTDVINIIPKKK